MITESENDKSWLQPQRHRRGLEWQLPPRVADAEAASPTTNLAQEELHGTPQVPSVGRRRSPRVRCLHNIAVFIVVSSDQNLVRPKNKTESTQVGILQLQSIEPPHQTSTKWISGQRKKSKKMDAVGIEPTTFHIIVDAKRLITVLVILLDRDGVRTS